jgi:hypothetical protein
VAKRTTDTIKHTLSTYNVCQHERCIIQGVNIFYKIWQFNLNCKGNMDFKCPVDWSFQNDKPSVKVVVVKDLIKCTPCIGYGHTEATADE